VAATGGCGGLTAAVDAAVAAASRRAASDWVLSRNLLINISASSSTLPSSPSSSGSMKAVLHPAMGSMERVCAAEGHIVVEAVAATWADGSGSSTAGTWGLNLARRYEEEAMMRLAVIMVDDSNREVLFRRRDSVIMRTS
jgi:hypothetical protein